MNYTRTLQHTLTVSRLVRCTNVEMYGYNSLHPGNHTTNVEMYGYNSLHPDNHTTNVHAHLSTFIITPCVPII